MQGQTNCRRKVEEELKEENKKRKKKSRIRGVEPRASERPDTFLGKHEMRVTDVTATPYPIAREWIPCDLMKAVVESCLIMESCAPVRWRCGQGRALRRTHGVESETREFIGDFARGSLLWLSGK